MDADMKKSLTDLIDETLMELEELKKSRFAASEVDLKGPGDGIAGKPSNGDLHAKKAEDDKDEDDKDEDDKEEKAEEAKKADGVNSEEVEKADKEDKDDKKEDKKEDKEEEKKEDKAEKSSEKSFEEALIKSKEETGALIKAQIDERVKPLEDKLSTILDLVNKIADQPVAPKGVTSKAIPLFKSADEGAPERMSKSEISSKLFELKKSGTKVESLDVTRAELGQDLDFITKKYNLSK